MSYRIVYGRKRRDWTAFRLQAVVSGWLLAAVMVGKIICPAVDALFVSQPDPAQCALARGYADGAGIRNAMVMYCAAVLEQAGYETEAVR